MTGFVALLRAVNVGGTGKLAMPTLAALCVAAGFRQVRTYIASGNVVFGSDAGEDAVRSALAARLHAQLGRPVDLFVRSAAEMSDVAARNPFAEAPPGRVMVLFVDAALPAEPGDGVSGQTDEQIRLGLRALYVFYPGGMGASRLRIPSEKHGTARNMQTVAKLAAMAAAVD